MGTCEKSGGADSTRVLSPRRIVSRVLPFAIALACATPSAAQASTQYYLGNAEFWQDARVTVTDGQITHFKAILGAIQCHDGSGSYIGEGNVYRIDAGGAFPIVDGHFHFTSPPVEEDVRGGTTTMTVDGDLRDGAMSGTLTAHTESFGGGDTCDGGGPFEAAVAPSTLDSAEPP